MAEVSTRQTVSIAKACELAAVSRRTVYNWMRLDKVEYLRTAGGSRRIFLDTLWRKNDGEDLPKAEMSSVPAGFREATHG